MTRPRDWLALAAVLLLMGLIGWGLYVLLEGMAAHGIAIGDWAA